LHKKTTDEVHNLFHIARLAILSETTRRELDEIASKMTYVDLSTTPGYMDKFVAALFIPHTDASLFPSMSRA